MIVLWLPIAAVLALAFRPTLDPTAAAGAPTFAVAIWGAYLIRSLLLWVLGMVTFWTTRVQRIFEAYFVAELLLSGGSCPMALMPDWVQHLAVVPAVPVDASASRSPRWSARSPTDELVVGLLAQLSGSRSAIVLVRVVWRRGVRRFSAVGG